MTTNPMPDWEKQCDAGRCAAEQGRFEDAETAFRAALAIAESAGTEDDRLSRSLEWLAYTCHGQHKLAEAEELYRRLLEIHERLCGAESEEVDRTLGWLWDVCLGQRKPAEAESFALRKLALRQKVCGPEHLSVAEALDKLVGPCLFQGRTAEVVAHYRAALAIREKTLGPEHREVADSLGRLAARLYGQEGDREAEALWRRALGIYEDLYQRRDTLDKREARHVAISVVGTLENLACWVYQDGRYEEAERFFRRQVAVLQDPFDPSRRAVPRNVDIFADVLVRQKQYPEAESLLKEEIARNDIDMRPRCLKVLAGLYAELGRDTEAEPIFRQAIAACEKSPEWHAFTLADVLEGYADFCHKAGREEEAAQLLARAQKVRAEHCPPGGAS